MILAQSLKNENAMRFFLVYVIRRVVLDRLPTLIMQDTPHLLSALRAYSQLFRIMEIPPELRLSIYQHHGTPHSVELRPRQHS